MTNWPAVNPGELRKRVEIQQRTPAIDGLGQQQLIWNTVLTTMAAIDDALYEQKPTGRELYDEGLVESRSTHVITMRWSKKVAVKPGDRVYYADQAYSPPVQHLYSVEWVENVKQMNLLLRLLCWEINSPA